MLTGIKKKAVVGKDGIIQLLADEFPEGTIVEVMIFIDTPVEEDETTYILKSEANKKQLFKAIENVNQRNLVYIDLDEYEKGSI